jgi:hypothetical protein
MCPRRQGHIKDGVQLQVQEPSRLAVQPLVLVQVEPPDVEHSQA